MNSPRLAPLARDDWDDDVEAALRAGIPGSAADRFLSDGPDALRVPNGLTTMVRHPDLAGPWLRYNDVLLRHATLAPRLRELMILRVAWRTRSTYEWVQHVRLAPRCDITPEEIEAIGRRTDPDSWSPLEAALIGATDQLLDHHRIDDATWKVLAEHFDDKQLIEVAFVVGTYACLAGLFNSLAIQLDPELENVAAPALPEE